MNPFKLLWSFYGRIGRLTYLGGQLLNLALAVGALAALVYLDKGQWGANAPGRLSEPVLVSIFLVGFALFTWAKLALAAKRLHDIGQTGWISLVLFIPFIGFVAVIVLLCVRGNEYDNQYGASRSSGMRSSATSPAV
jgi:uncharacterized membrane protein YhaH (DUF805 family)